MNHRPRDIYPVTKKEERAGRFARLGGRDVLLDYLHRSAGWSGDGPKCVLRHINRGALTTHRRFYISMCFFYRRGSGALRRLRFQPADKSGRLGRVIRVAMGFVASLARGREF